MQWRQLVSCDWSWHSHGSLIPGKFDLKINRSMKTPWEECSRVACSYSSAPGTVQYTLLLTLALRSEEELTIKTSASLFLYGGTCTNMPNSCLYERNSTGVGATSGEQKGVDRTIIFAVTLIVRLNHNAEVLFFFKDFNLKLEYTSQTIFKADRNKRTQIYWSPHQDVFLSLTSKTAQ